MDNRGIMDGEAMEQREMKRFLVPKIPVGYEHGVF